MASALLYLDLSDQTRILISAVIHLFRAITTHGHPCTSMHSKLSPGWLWCPTDHPQFPAKTCSPRDEEQFPIDLGEIRRTRVPPRNYILDQYGACRSAITLP